MGFVSWTLGGEDERQRLTTRVVTVSEVMAGEAAPSLFELAIPVGAPLVDRTVDPPRLGTYQGE
jgi:hypothetical protein